MIAPQELRIGNIVRLKSKNKDYVIDSGYEIDTGTDSDDFEPIELTEDWLRKLNFVCLGKKRNWFDYNLNGRIVLSISLDGILLINLNGEFSNIGSVKYVHQLQNLIFALTGEELKIKES